MTVRVIRELIYTYPDAETYIRDKKNWTLSYCHARGFKMQSVVVHEVIEDEGKGHK